MLGRACLHVRLTMYFFSDPRRRTNGGIAAKKLVERVVKRGPTREIVVKAASRGHVSLSSKIALVDRAAFFRATFFFAQI